jgi:hypothetical protein
VARAVRGLAFLQRGAVVPRVAQVGVGTVGEQPPDAGGTAVAGRDVRVGVARWAAGSGSGRGPGRVTRGKPAPFTPRVGCNLIAVPAAALGYLNPLFAGIAMQASSLIVTGSSLRLGRDRRRRATRPGSGPVTAVAAHTPPMYSHAAVHGAGSCAIRR